MRLIFLAAALVAVLATAAHGAPDATKVRRGTGTLVLRGWTGRRGVWNKLCATQCRPAPQTGHLAGLQRRETCICAHVASILCPPGRLGALHSPTLRIGVRQRSAAYVALAYVSMYMI